MKHVLNAKQYDRESLEKLFELTDDIQKNEMEKLLLLCFMNLVRERECLFKQRF